MHEVNSEGRESRAVWWSAYERDDGAAVSFLWIFRITARFRNCMGSAVVNTLNSELTHRICSRIAERQGSPLLSLGTLSRVGQLYSITGLSPSMVVFSNTFRFLVYNNYPSYDILLASLISAAKCTLTRLECFGLTAVPCGTSRLASLITPKLVSY
jgi:hypothetical protein